MKEIRSIVKAYQSIDFGKTRAALATVVRVEGSSYRRAGARMLVLDNGTTAGVYIYLEKGGSGNALNHIDAADLTLLATIGHTGGNLSGVDFSFAAVI